MRRFLVLYTELSPSSYYPIAPGDSHVQGWPSNRDGFANAGRDEGEFRIALEFVL